MTSRLRPLGAGPLLSPSLTAFSRTTGGESIIALSLFNLARRGSFGVGGSLGGAFVDAGMPDTASSRSLCSAVSRHWGSSSDGEPPNAERDLRATHVNGAAPDGAGGGTNDG